MDVIQSQYGPWPEDALGKVTVEGPNSETEEAEWLTFLEGQIDALCKPQQDLRDDLNPLSRAGFWILATGVLTLFTDNDAESIELFDFAYSDKYRLSITKRFQYLNTLCSKLESNANDKTLSNEDHNQTAERAV